MTQTGQAAPEGAASPLIGEATITLIGKRGPVGVDASIAPVVQALWNAGIDTVASCSGHGFRPACIALSNGCEIFIARNFAEARQIDLLFPLNIQGERRDGLTDFFESALREAEERQDALADAAALREAAQALIDDNSPAVSLDEQRALWDANMARLARAVATPTKHEDREPGQ